MGVSSSGSFSHEESSSFSSSSGFGASGSGSAAAGSGESLVQMKPQRVKLQLRQSKFLSSWLQAIIYLFVSPVRCLIK